MPGERLENSLALHLVFCQVVQDVYNNGCIRINKEDRIKMRGMLGKKTDKQTCMLMGLITINKAHQIILLINVKMPTIVGILTFISRMNTISDSFKQEKIVIFQYFSFYEQLKFKSLMPLGLFWESVSNQPAKLQR